MSEIKTCAICKHVDYYAGSPWYSEVTPGAEASISCCRQHRLPDLDDPCVDLFKDLVRIGSSCPDFEVDK